MVRNGARTITIIVAAVWVLAIALWLVCLRLPRTVAATGISAARRQQAMQSTVALPLAWEAGQPNLPLLPVTGQLLRRSDQTVLSGAGLVPGTLQAQSLALTVQFRAVPFNLYGKLGRPLLPFVPSASSPTLPAAQTVELVCGIRDPAQFAGEGLHLRWDNASLTVYGADSQTPLFPGRRLSLFRSASNWCRLRFSVAGNHVTCRVADYPVLDFHTTSPPGGAFGIAAYDGVISLSEIKLEAAE